MAKHIIIVCAVLAIHFVALSACIVCRHWLTALCDFFFLEVRPPPEGLLTADSLRKLWSSPTDGLDLTISFDSEGGWRTLLRPTDHKRTTHG